MRIEILIYIYFTWFTWETLRYSKWFDIEDNYLVQIIPNLNLWIKSDFLLYSENKNYRTLKNRCKMRMNPNKLILHHHIRSFENFLEMKQLEVLIWIPSENLPWSILSLSHPILTLLIIFLSLEQNSDLSLFFIIINCPNEKVSSICIYTSYWISIFPFDWMNSNFKFFINCLC